jgi:HEAT repeat protein
MKSRTSLGVLLSIAVAIGVVSLGKNSDAQEKEPVYEGKTVAQWIELLKSRNADQRDKAAHALTTFGPQAKAAVPALAEALKDSETYVRQRAAFALGQIGPGAASALPALADVLRNDKQELVRVTAAYAMGRIGLQAKFVPDLLEACKGVAGENARAALRQIGPGPDGKAAVPALIKALEDEKWWVRAIAAECLGRVGPEAGAAVPALLKLFNDERLQVRCDAAEAVGRIRGGAKPAAAIAALRELLLREDHTGLHSASALAELGEPGVVALTHALESGKPGARKYAVIALQEVGPVGKAAVRALIKALQHEDVRIRSPAAYSLGRIGPAAKAAVAALTETLRDPDGHVRINAADALRRIDNSSAGVAALIDVCKDASDSNRSNRCTAAMVLGDFGPAAKEAVPALLELLKDSDRYLPCYAAFSLWQIAKHDRAIPVLIEKGRGSEGPDSEFLGQIGPEAKAAVPALTKAAADKDAFRAFRAIEALGKIGAEAKSAIPVIRPFLKTDDVRKVGAALALWRLERSRDAVPALIESLQSHKYLDGGSGDSFVRWRAAEALRDIGPEAQAAIPALRAALYDEDTFVRHVAAAALKRIDTQRATATD